MKYEVVYTLVHDGREYAPGDVVDMGKEQAEPLVARGTLKPPKADPVPPNPGMAPPAMVTNDAASVVREGV